MAGARRWSSRLSGNLSVLIRPYRDDDASATAEIFFDSIRYGTASHYDEVQRQAWAPDIPEPPGWQARLGPQTVFVAERGGSVIGFMSLTRSGCIDLAYMLPDAIGQGVARSLYEQILSTALRDGLTRLYTEASHLALPFFQRQGWRVVKRQTVSRNGVALENFVMETEITEPGNIG